MTNDPVTISRVGADGDGVGALADGTPVYVPFTLPGEIVRVAPAGKRGEGIAGVAEAITTAANALMGRWRSRFGAASNSTAIASAPTTPVSWVLAPEASATGVRDELLLIGKP